MAQSTEGGGSSTAVQSFGKGPFVRTAFLAEAILEETSGTISYIRVFDQTAFQSDGPMPDDDTRPLVRFSLVVEMVAGAARGGQTCKLEWERPSGARRELVEVQLSFDGRPDCIRKLTMGDINVQAYEGLHWFDFSVAGELLTRIPWTVRSQYGRVTGAR